MNLLDEYKELYDKELAFGERLNAKISTSLTLLTLLGSGLVFLLNGILPFYANILWAIYLSLFLLCVVAFIYSCYYFFKSYNKYTYAHIAIKETKDYFEECKKIAQSQNLKDELILNNIEVTLSNYYVNAAITNRSENLRKNQMQKKLSFGIIILFCLLMVSFAYKIVFFDSVYNAEVIHKIEVIGGEIMCNEKENPFPPAPPLEMITETFAEYKKQIPEVKPTPKVETGADE